MSEYSDAHTPHGVLLAQAAPKPALSEYRASAGEQERIGNLISLIPHGGRNALDIGARDGYISLQLAELFDEVTALDLDRPDIADPRVKCVSGDVTALDFPDDAFDLVLCSEVLEHIPPAALPQACSEIVRITRRHALIGVPFRQDTRLGRTLCRACGGKNPPWGHVNVFDGPGLVRLFPGMRAVAQNLVGSSKARTNALSTWLADLAGNPYGTYDQDEPCTHCGASLTRPGSTSLARRALASAAIRLNRLQARLQDPRPVWIHVLLSKSPA